MNLMKKEDNIKNDNSEEDDTNNYKIENLTEEENNVIKENIIKDLESDINSLKNNIYDNDIKDEIQIKTKKIKKRDISIKAEENIESTQKILLIIQKI